MSNENVEFDEEIPWISFSDASIALLFVFIATTFWFMIQLQIAKQELLEQTKERKHVEKVRNTYKSKEA